jgi:hypothetical protein
LREFQRLRNGRSGLEGVWISAAAAFWFIGAVLQGPRASTTEDFAFLYGYVAILALLVSFVVYLIGRAICKFVKAVRD